MSKRTGRNALRGALGEETPSEQSSLRSSSTPSPQKRSSPRKGVGKENRPRATGPASKRTPSKQQSSTSKAGTSRGRPAESSSEEEEETPQRTKSKPAKTTAQKKTARAPSPVSEDEDSDEPSFVTQNRSSRSHVRQPRSPSMPTPKRGRPPKNQPRPIQKPAGAAKRKTGIPVFREMQRLQTTVECQIPRAPFSRVVRENMQRCEERGAHLRITAEALEALRESAEAYLTLTFSDAYLITLNRKQVTLAPKDIQLLMFLRGPTGVARNA